jgi:hypothetical protein
VEHAQPLPVPFPWRATTVVVGGIALVELIVLIAIGLTHFAPKSHPHAARLAPRAHQVEPAPRHVKPVPSVPLRPRDAVRVLVLNGNGISGAAATQAAQLQGDGYRIGGTTNAARHDYATSMVMYVPGWVKEARRLAHESGVRIVAPVDGLRPAQLKGSKLILLLGS